MDICPLQNLELHNHRFGISALWKLLIIERRSSITERLEASGDVRNRDCTELFSELKALEDKARLWHSAVMARIYVKLQTYSERDSHSPSD